MKAYADKQKFTYAKTVMDFCQQKKDPHRIQITAGRNLIQYKGKVSMRTADLTMSKLLWNSVLSTCNTNNMCLDINFLSHRCTQLFQIHENAAGGLPRLD